MLHRYVLLRRLIVQLAVTFLIPVEHWARLLVDVVFFLQAEERGSPLFLLVHCCHAEGFELDCAFLGVGNLVLFEYLRRHALIEQKAALDARTAALSRHW